MRHPLWNVLFEPSAPVVEFRDLASSASDLTTYTFSAMNLGDIGSVATISGDDYLVNPQVRSPGRKFIVVNVHGERALAATLVNSVTIGGVSGTEITDGASTLVNTAAYVWDTQALQGIANTDVVVTWSAAVTACAVGILAVKNVGLFKNTTVANLANTGDIPAAYDSTVTTNDLNGLFICATTCEGLETMTFRNADTVFEGSRPVMFLYEGQNAEFSFGCIWTYSPQYNGANPHLASAFINWSGAGNGTATSLGFI